MADAVVADGAGKIRAAPDRFTGPDDKQVGGGAEARQDIADVSLSEPEQRLLGGAVVVEHAINSSPVRLGHLLLRHAQPGSRHWRLGVESDRPLQDMDRAQIFPGGLRVRRRPPVGGPGGG
jgi:hypothetical protein